MGNRRLYKTECFHTIGTPESELLKVTALNLLHPTASPLFKYVGFFHIVTQPPRGEGKGGGDVILFDAFVLIRAACFKMGMT